MFEIIFFLRFWNSDFGVFFALIDVLANSEWTASAPATKNESRTDKRDSCTVRWHHRTGYNE
jgi:hypothetical protein